MKLKSPTIPILGTLLLIFSSCIPERNLYQGNEEGGGGDYENFNDPIYMYGFSDEVSKTEVEITVRATEKIDFDKIKIDIPPLKYNKSWLFMLTQDDASHSSYSSTWAAINGKPLIHVVGNHYYYGAKQLRAGDLPPGTYYLKSTLGCTDGAGNEIRFAPSLTLWAENPAMALTYETKPGFVKNYYRFYKKTTIVWDDIMDMLNYGAGIAFHDVEAEDVNNPEAIRNHYDIAQKIILEKLNGRGCKSLAEPNGNKTYITAAQAYDPIKTMTAQQGATNIYPFKTDTDLSKVLQERVFYDQADDIKKLIEAELTLPKEDRKAIHIGVHSTAEDQWVNFLLWLNNQYGKDGDDSVWFPSMEEYYEYVYYRIHGSRKLEKIDDYTVKMTLTLPSEQYFYYPSTTINLYGVKKEQITSVTSNDAVTGLSYGNFTEGTAFNIDCRKHLLNHATHYVEVHEEKPDNRSRKTDALYFVQMLKDSNTKTELLKRIK